MSLASTWTEKQGATACRFTSKSALKDVHQQSEPYFEFKKFADGLDCVISKEGFGTFETGLGYVGR